MLKNEVIVEIISNHEKYRFAELLDRFKIGEVLHLKAPSTAGKTDFSRWNTSPTQSEFFESDNKLTIYFETKNINIPDTIYLETLLSKTNLYQVCLKIYRYFF